MLVKVPEGQRRVGVIPVTSPLCRLAAIAGLCLLAALVGAPARADGQTLQTISDAVGVNNIPADYVIVCDTSRSMQDNSRYDGLRAGVRQFIAALAPTDKLSLITFDTRATVVYQGDVGESPDAIVNRLPVQANGNNTDIGSALDQAVGVLERPGAPGIATVVLLTDGMHAPPVGSKYPFDQGYAWGRLHDRAILLHKQSLSAYAIPLTGSTDAHLLGSVFPGATTLDPAAVNQVVDRLQRPKAAVRAAKIKSALTDDLSRGVDVVWPKAITALDAGTNSLSVRLRAQTSTIPLTVTNLRVNSATDGLTVRLGLDKADLRPGQPVDVPLTLVWAAGARSWSYRDGRRLDVPLTLVGSVSSPWATTLVDDLAIPFNPAPIASDARAVGTANVGRPIVWQGGAGAVVLIAALIVAWVRLHPRLHGALAIASPTRAVHFVRLPRLQTKTTLDGQVADTTAPVGIRMRRTRDGMRLELAFGARRRGKVRRLTMGEHAVVSSVQYTWHPDEAHASQVIAQTPLPMPGPSAPGPGPAPLSASPTVPLTVQTPATASAPVATAQASVVTPSPATPPVPVAGQVPAPPSAFPLPPAPARPAVAPDAGDLPVADGPSIRFD